MADVRNDMAVADRLQGHKTKWQFLILSILSILLIHQKDLDPDRLLARGCREAALVITSPE